MRRSLSRFDVTCLGLNAIVGSGIFLLPDDLYREMGALSPFAFLLCAIGLLPVALCYAEAASYGDDTGGPYLYARDAFGPSTGFVVGWMCFANALFSFAAVSSAASAYAVRLLPGLEPALGPRAIAAGVIALFAALNYVGAKPGAIAVDLFTVAKFAVLVVLVCALAPGASGAHLSAELPHGWSGVGSATFIALFAAQGFEVVPVPAGETRAPQRDLPIAIVSSLLAASLLYVLVQTVLVASGASLSEPSDTPLVDAALAFAPALAFLVVAGGLVSTLGFVSGSALGTPRYLFAAAADRHLPAALGAVHPRFGSPHVAIVATAALAIALVVSFDYRALIGMSNVAVAVQYFATCLAVPFLRRRGVPGRRIPGGPIVPLLGAAVSLWVFTEASREELVWAGVALSIGLAAMWPAFLRRNGASPIASEAPRRLCAIVNPLLAIFAALFAIYGAPLTRYPEATQLAFFLSMLLYSAATALAWSQRIPSNMSWLMIVAGLITAPVGLIALGTGIWVRFNLLARSPSAPVGNLPPNPPPHA